MIGRIIGSALFGLAALCWFGGLLIPALWGVALVFTTLGLVCGAVAALYEVIANG